MQTLTWNGREINGWICSGNELKPETGANSRNTWILQGNRIKPKYGANNSNAWNIGNAPLLVAVGNVILRLF